MVLPRIALVFGTSKRGFTLLELLLVIVIIGLLGRIVVPQFQKLQPGYKRQKFIEDLNVVIASAWYSALATHVVQKVVFDLKKRVVTIQPDTPTAQDASLLPSSLQKDQIVWPEAIEIKQFFINGKNDIGTAGQTINKVWFYIVPEGLSQNVVLNMVDASEIRTDGSAFQFGLVLNPFTGRLHAYDSFQKP